MSKQFSPDAERVLSLVSGYRNPFARRLLMLQAMVDDSGTRSGPMFLLGALVAPVSNWVKFTEEWNAELDQPPRAPYFKLQDAIKAIGEYWGAGSRPEMLEVKVQKLNKIVQRHVIRAFSIEMSILKFNKHLKPALDEFVEFDKDTKQFNVEGASSPYFFLALMLLRGMDYLGLIEETRVVFDEQKGEDLGVQKWWNHLLETYNKEARKPLVQKTPDYRADQDFAPLQAANSLAWLVHRTHETAPLSSLVIKEPTLDDFLGEIPLYRKTITSQWMKTWGKDLAKANRSNRKALRRGYAS